MPPLPSGLIGLTRLTRRVRPASTSPLLSFDSAGVPAKIPPQRRGWNDTPGTSLERSVFVSICRVCILGRRTDLKHGDLGVISEPLRHSRLFLSSPLDSPFFPLLPPPPPLPPVTSASFGLRWLRLKANEATNVWKDRNLLCFKSVRQPSPRLAQQCLRGEGVQRSRSVLHDGALHAPFLTNNPPPPRLASRLLSLYLSLCFWAVAWGQVHLRGA